MAAVPADEGWLRCDALNPGDTVRHDAQVVAAAQRLYARGCVLVALTQFSLARAATLVRASVPLPVVTTVDSAVLKLRSRLGG